MEGALSEFEIKDSGERQEFASGMVRDTANGKTSFLSVLVGPMLNRWAKHLTKARTEKYPDPMPGRPNWTLAEGEAEYIRAKESAVRHAMQWAAGERDEDHAAAVFFNINLAEYVLEVAEATGTPLDPSLGVNPNARRSASASVLSSDSAWTRYMNKRRPEFPPLWAGED